MDHDGSWIFMDDPCAGDATTQQERPVGLGWHGDPYWGQTNSPNRRWIRWSHVSLGNCRHTNGWTRSWLWNLPTAHMSQRKARNTKLQKGRRDKMRQDDVQIFLDVFPRFATSFVEAAGRSKHSRFVHWRCQVGISVLPSVWTSIMCQSWKCWKPWKRWKLSHLKRLINWHHLEWRKWKNPQYNDT